MYQLSLQFFFTFFVYNLMFLVYLFPLLFRNLSMLKVEEPKSMQRFAAMGCQVICCRICKIVSLVLVLYVVDFISYGFWLGDAYHITQPPSDGRGAILAMTRALRQVSFTVLYWFAFFMHYLRFYVFWTANLSCMHVVIIIFSFLPHVLYMIMSSKLHTPYVMW